MVAKLIEHARLLRRACPTVKAGGSFCGPNKKSYRHFERGEAERTCPSCKAGSPLFCAPKKETSQSLTMGLNY
jgi:hypothetical protein